MDGLSQGRHALGSDNQHELKLVPRGNAGDETYCWGNILSTQAENGFPDSNLWNSASDIRACLRDYRQM